MKKITYWQHPSADQKLVLEGTPETTRFLAEEIFCQNIIGLTYSQGEMEDEEFEKLREFEG